MRTTNIVLVVAAVGILTACRTVAPDRPARALETVTNTYYLPNAVALRVVTVSTNGPAMATVLIQTHAVAVKETGPKETVARFGEVYAFAPAFIAVYRGEPTRIRFWNLQPDDQHDFMLLDPQLDVLMKVLLPPLQEISYVFTFHEEGLYMFVCTMHQPEMGGQILVLPPRRS